MESSFKTTMFGGFERQSVIDYIEKNAQEAAQTQEKLHQENEELAAAKAAPEQELVSLRKQVTDLEEKSGRLSAELEEKSAALGSAQQELEQIRPRMEELTAEAEAYARVKAHIGEIECSAQKRADDLEASVMQRLNQQLAEYKRQYQELVTTFNVASDHVLGELRKVEVNLSQLPRTFDKMGGDLADLEHVLQKK